MQPLDRLLTELHDALRPYHQLQLDVDALVRGWQLLDPEARRMVGGLAPELIDAVLRVEHHARRLVDA